MHRCEKIGAFGLTEPEVGSGAARGLTTSARRDGNDWILNGEKAWIGNATFADVVVIWARDIEDGQVKGFLVEKGTPGLQTEKMERKIALRAVQNARIRLDDCRVGEENRLANARSFKDTARVLRMTRSGVAWEAVGCAQGAFEHALRYAREREQFGRPIGGFQLVQDLLVRMLGNHITELGALNADSKYSRSPDMSKCVLKARCAHYGLTQRRCGVIRRRRSQTSARWQGGSRDAILGHSRGAIFPSSRL